MVVGGGWGYRLRLDSSSWNCRFVLVHKLMDHSFLYTSKTLVPPGLFYYHCHCYFLITINNFILWQNPINQKWYTVTICGVLEFVDQSQITANDHFMERVFR